jgi:hypothetical protein
MWIDPKEKLPRAGEVVSVIRTEWKTARLATLFSDSPMVHFRLIDCTHTQQNNYCQIDGTKWKYARAKMGVNGNGYSVIFDEES